MRVREIHEGRRLYTCATYASVAELAAYSGPIAPHAARRRDSARGGEVWAQVLDRLDGKVDWIGCTREAARARLVSGWPEGLAQAQALAERVQRMAENLAPRDVRRRPRYSEESGDEVDLDRMRAGAPWWRECVRSRHVQARALTLAVQVGGLADVSEESLRWNSVLALALVHVFEGAGIACSVRAVAASDQCHNRADETLVRILEAKRSEDAMLPDLLAAVLAPSTFRACMIPSVQLLAKRPDEGGGSTVAVASMPQAVLDYLADGAPLIVLPHVFNEADALTAARRVLRLHEEGEALAS